MKTILALLVTAAFVQISKQDSCHWREIDSCLNPAVAALRESLIPQNDEQVEEQCKLGRETYNCLKNFTDKCTSKLQREILSFATESARATFDNYCTAGSDLRKSILEKSECLTQAWEEQKSCVSDAQAGIESVNEAAVENRLDTLCCTYNRYRSCGTEIVRQKCGDEIEDWIEKISGLVVSNLPNRICNSCGDEDTKCKNLLPALGTKPKGSSSESAIGQILGIYFDN